MPWTAGGRVYNKPYCTARCIHMPACEGKPFGILLRRGRRGDSCTSREWSLTIQDIFFADKVPSDGLKWFGKNTFYVDNALLLHR